MLRTILALAVAGAALGAGCHKPPVSAGLEGDPVTTAPLSQTEGSASAVKPATIETATFALG